MSATIFGRLPSRAAFGNSDLVLRLVLGAGAVWLPLYVGALAWKGDAGWVTDVPQVAPPLAAGLASLLAARRARDGARMLWSLLAASSLLWAAGALLGTLSGHLADGSRPSVSVSDGLLVTSLAVLVPVAFLAVPRVVEVRPRGWLDALDASVMVAAIGFAGYDLLIEPQATWPLSGADAVGIAYPLAGIAVLTGLAVTISRSNGEIPTPVAVVAAAIVVVAVNAAVYTYAATLNGTDVHEWLGIGWQAEGLLLVTAALLTIHGRGGALRMRWSFEDINLPVVLGGLAITQVFVTVCVILRRQDLGAVLATWFTVSAVLLRLVLAGRARHRLGDALGAALDRQRRLERDRDVVFAQMLRAEADERARVAADLHDDTVQIMIATLVSLDRVASGARDGDPHRMATAAAVARRTLAEAVERTRRLMFELRPPLLETHGLRAALEDTAAVLRRESAVKVTVAAPGGRYPAALEALVFRTIQEALSNVRKHASADTVRIEVRDDGRVLHGRVVDDGQGFEPRASTSGLARMHYGIAMMVERIRLADGDCWISSRPGGGCTVAFALPHGGVIAAA
jgi:signal transduction histidine kinase